MPRSRESELAEGAFATCVGCLRRSTITSLTISRTHCHFFGESTPIGSSNGLRQFVNELTNHDTSAQNGGCMGIDPPRRSHSRPVQNRGYRQVLRNLIVMVVFWYLLIKPMVISLLDLPGPWGPFLTAQLPNGWVVAVQGRRNGADSQERYLVRAPSGAVVVDSMTVPHAGGFLRGTVRYSTDGSQRIVVVLHRPFRSDEVGASFDCLTRTFETPEVLSPWATVAFGGVVSHGAIRSWSDLFLPL